MKFWIFSFSCCLSHRFLRGLVVAGGELHHHPLPGFVPQHGWSGCGSRAGTLHWHQPLPAGLWVQRRWVSAALLWRALPSGLRSPHQPEPQRRIAGPRRVREVIKPQRQTVWRSARSAGRSDCSLRGLWEASSSGAAPGNRSHQYHGPLTAKPRVQTGPA